MGRLQERRPAVGPLDRGLDLLSHLPTSTLNHHEVRLGHGLPRVFLEKLETLKTDPLRLQLPPVLYHSELDGYGTTVPISCSRTPASCKNCLIEIKMKPMVVDIVFEVIPSYLLPIPFRKSTPKSNDPFFPKNPRWPLLLLNSSDTQNEPQSCRAAFVIALAFLGANQKSFKISTSSTLW